MILWMIFGESKVRRIVRATAPGSMPSTLASSAMFLNLPSSIIFCHEKDIPAAPEEQPDLFADYEALKKKKAAEQAELDKEKRLQQAVLNIKKRMGANAILKGMNLEKGATGKVRNEQIGGHRK